MEATTEVTRDYTATRTAEQHLAECRRVALGQLEDGRDQEDVAAEFIAELRKHQQTKGKAVPVMQALLNGELTTRARAKRAIAGVTIS